MKNEKLTPEELGQEYAKFIGAAITAGGYHLRMNAIVEICSLLKEKGHNEAADVVLDWIKEEEAKAEASWKALDALETTKG